MLDLNDIRLFLKVAESGSLTKTADRLSMPKSKLSRRIQMLENQLDYRLFAREKNRLILTSHGNQLAQQYRSLFIAIEEQESIATQSGQIVEGLLKISAPSDLINTHFSYSLADFKKMHPKIDIECYVCNQYDRIAIDDYDIALLISAHQLPDGDHIAKKLFDVQSSIFISTKFNIDSNRAHPIASLTNYPMISHTYKDSWTFSNDEQSQELPVNSTLKVDSINAQKIMVSSGLGIARLPDFICQEEVKKGEMKAINLVEKPLPYQVYVVYRERNLQPKNVEAFIAYYKNAAKDMGL